MATELRNRRLPLKSLKFPYIFSHSLRNRLKFSQLPTHLCTHFCPPLHPTSLQNPSPFLPTVSDPHCIRPTPLPFTQSFLSYPLSYLTASYGVVSTRTLIVPVTIFAAPATPTESHPHCIPDHPCSHECPLSNYWPLHTF